MFFDEKHSFFAINVAIIGFNMYNKIIKATKEKQQNVFI